MTASRQDVEAQLDAAVAEFKLTTSSGAKMVSQYGPDPSKWPAGHWRNGATLLAAARAEVGQLLDPAPAPTPPPDAVQPEPPPFTPTRTLPAATTWNELQTALAALQPGDRLPCQGIAMPGEAVFARQLSAPAEVVFDSACKANGGKGLLLPAIWLKDIANLRLIAKGFVVTNPIDGPGLTIGAATNCVLDGWDIRNCGGSGIGAGATNGNIAGNYIRATVRDWALNLPLDNHQEKGTGLHGMILENSQTTHRIDHNTVVLTTPGSKMGGSAIELGNNNAATAPTGNRLWLAASNLLQDAKIQTAANGLNLYGHQVGTVVLNVIANGLHGYALQSDPYSGTFSVTVMQGSATNCCLNPLLQGKSPWMTRGGIVYSPGPFTPKP